MFALLPAYSLLLASYVSAIAISSACSSCSISKASLKLPSNQTVVVKPVIAPSFIGLALGVQNYTCSNTSTYTNVGAVATLFDASCAIYKPSFSNIQNQAFDLWRNASSSASPSKIASRLPDFRKPVTLGQHYFITNPITGVGLSPVWDFRTARNPDAFVVAAKVGDIPAPTGKGDVDWLSLTSVEGPLASQIFRVDTKGGQPPATCTPGSELISVKYTAKYWLYGGSVKR